MKLTIALPGLLWKDSNSLKFLSPKPSCINLDQLIKRSSNEILELSYSDFLYFEESESITISYANHYAKKLNVANEYSRFLIAEPTHLRVDRDRLIPLESELLQLNHNEALEIIDSINNHFNGEIKLYYIDEHTWLLGLNFDSQNYNFYPLIEVIGRDINNYLPSQDVSYLLKLINEIQMLLFNNKINQQRQEDKLLAINSLWLWDKKFSNEAVNFFKTFSLIYKTNCSYNAKLNWKTKALTELDLDKVEDDSLIIIDSLYYSNCYEDYYSWVNKLQVIDNLYFKPLKEKFMQGAIKNIDLLVPTINQTLKIYISHYNFFKFWQNNTLLKIMNNIKLKGKI